MWVLCRRRPSTSPLEAIERLVKAVAPLRIIVFGSHARDEARPDSDLDVVPTDPEEIARRGETTGSVLRSALREGTVVYERDA